VPSRCTTLLQGTLDPGEETAQWTPFAVAIARALEA
jgi:hypothetical protein